MPRARDANPNRPEPDALGRRAKGKDEALESLLGQSLVWVEPGPFLMGSDAARDPQADQREFPQHRVTLPG
jgi:formylglycine-generating enzyme required for sulfatase activity